MDIAEEIQTLTGHEDQVLLVWRPGCRLDTRVDAAYDFYLEVVSNPLESQTRSRKRTHWSRMPIKTLKL